MKNFISKYSDIAKAIIATLAMISAVYAFEIKPRLDDKIKTEIAKNNEAIEWRIRKMECNIYAGLSKEEKEAGNKMYKELYGK